eukprot:gnl/TRDRNA2_/TRDRNA2_80503_c0_seq1.p2 gnl/TRDRNA2_/TRDRNA2_80503_c0~~gnl/TRDRNA2_/TRDRNA2_80503_c0_seq1.p2  ORF type:complete len:118 (+),score=23.64 gnl/TRDRNA2_/TRDRNA2_80503_c0_seq1:99-452(+)
MKPLLQVTLLLCLVTLFQLGCRFTYGKTLVELYLGKTVAVPAGKAGRVNMGEIVGGALALFISLIILSQEIRPLPEEDKKKKTKDAAASGGVALFATAAAYGTVIAIAIGFASMMRR